MFLRIPTKNCFILLAALTSPASSIPHSGIPKNITITADLSVVRTGGLHTLGNPSGSLADVDLSSRHEEFRNLTHNPFRPKALLHLPPSIMAVRANIDPGRSSYYFTDYDPSGHHRSIVVINSELNDSLATDAYLQSFAEIRMVQSDGLTPEMAHRVQAARYSVYSNVSAEFGLTPLHQYSLLTMSPEQLAALINETSSRESIHRDIVSAKNGHTISIERLAEYENNVKSFALTIQGTQQEIAHASRHVTAPDELLATMTKSYQPTAKLLLESKIIQFQEDMAVETVKQILSSLRHPDLHHIPPEVLIREFAQALLGFVSIESKRRVIHPEMSVADAVSYWFTFGKASLKPYVSEPVDSIINPYFVRRWRLSAPKEGSIRQELFETLATQLVPYVPGGPLTYAQAHAVAAQRIQMIAAYVNSRIWRNHIPQ